MNRPFAEALSRVEVQSPNERIHARLRQANIHSVAQLARAAENSRSRTAGLYCWLLGHVGGPAAERTLLRTFRGSRRSLWFQAAVALTFVDRPTTVPVLTAIVLRDRQPVRREASAYALGCIDPDNRTAEVAVALTHVLETDDVARVRAQAAESLAGVLRFRMTEKRSRRTAERALIENLTDKSADVRFWCAYAVGELRAKAAIPVLRKLAKDQTVVPGWWEVGLEARDAVRVIAGRTWPTRIRRRVRTRRT